MLVGILLSVSVGVSGMSVRNADHVCYFNNSSPYRLYSTKTLYEDVYYKQPAQEQKLPDCQPSLLYLMVRHGSRFPSDDDVVLMDTLLPALRDQIVQSFTEGSSSLCTEDVDRLKTWRLRFSVANASELAPVGHQEMLSIARRFQTRFPGLLKKEYSDAELRARSTYKDRTIESAKGFLEGLFNRTDINPVFLPKGEERILRFYDSCKRYEDELDDVPIEELQRFINGPVYATMVRTVEARLGLPQGNLSKDAVSAMSRMCMFDHVLYGDSPWCAAFSESDLRVIEYSQDLKYYYSRSYGAPKFAVEMSCEMMKDFFQHLRNGASSSYSGPRAVLRFAHSREVQTFMSALGLYAGDAALTADNMAAEAKRNWRTSLIGPFAANVGFAIYLCKDSKEAKIQTFVNEKPIVLPGCSQNICKFSEVFQDSKEFADTCDFDAICGNATGGSARVISTTTVCVSIVIRLIFG